MKNSAKIIASIAGTILLIARLVLMITSIVLVIVKLQQSNLHWRYYYNNMPATGWQSNHSFSSGFVSSGSVGGLSVGNGSRPPRGKRGTSDAKAQGGATKRRNASHHSNPNMVVSTIDTSRRELEDKM